jgi:periplasmic protein TonB
MPIKEVLPKAVAKPKLPSIPVLKAPTQLFVKNIAITKIESQATRLATNLDSVAISGRTMEGSTNAPVPVGGTIAGTNDGPTAAEPAAMVDKMTPLYSAEVMPAFPGGMEALRKFLQKHLHNPQEMETGELVSVKIKFVVGFEGKLKSFEIIEDGGTIFNNEVIRVLKKMPEWIPGKSNGQAVSVYYTIPVKFTPAE